MKIRKSFVSNSSSSSFVIVGMKFDRKQELELAKKFPNGLEGGCFWLGKIVGNDHFLSDENFSYAGKILADIHSDGDYLNNVAYNLEHVWQEAFEVLKMFDIKKEDIKIYTGTRMC